MKKFFSIFGSMVLVALIVTSCIKKQFDNPPDTTNYDPNLSVNGKIQTLSNSGLALPMGKGRVFGDTTIYGIVTADDRSGNFYKEIVIQDSTGGIVVVIDKTYLYNDYPIGRKVYVNLKGLYLANYKGLPEIVYSVDAAGNTTGIPSALVSNYVVKASSGNEVTPVELTMQKLYSNSSKYLNRLVKIDNMQFTKASTGVQYAQPSTIATGTQLIIQDCSIGASITLYNSGYATFQPAITPSGNGTLSGIFSTYGSSPQFLIRDTFDVRMNNTRVCP